MDEQLKRLYILVLKRGFKVVEVFRWENGIYTIAVARDSEPGGWDFVTLQPRGWEVKVKR